MLMPWAILTCATRHSPASDDTLYTYYPQDQNVIKLPLTNDTPPSRTYREDAHQCEPPLSAFPLSLSHVDPALSTSNILRLPAIPYESNVFPPHLLGDLDQPYGFDALDIGSSTFVNDLTQALVSALRFNMRILISSVVADTTTRMNTQMWDQPSIGRGHLGRGQQVPRSNSFFSHSTIATPHITPFSSRRPLSIAVCVLILFSIHRVNCFPSKLCITRL